MKNLLVLVLVFTLLITSEVFADEQKTITINMISPAGVRNNFLRILTDQIQKSRSDVKFVFAIHVGAAELIALRNLATSAPMDNKVGVFSMNALNSIAILNEKEAREPIEKLSFVLHLVEIPTAIITNPKSLINSPKDLINYIKNSALTAGSPGRGALPYWLYVIEKAGGNLKNFQYINYNGPTVGILDVVSNRLEFAAMNIGDVAPMIRAGKIKPIGLASRQKLAAFPELPLIPDYLPGATYSAVWVLAMAPGSTAEQVTFIRDMFVLAMNQPECLQFIQDNYMQVRPEFQSPESAVKRMLDLRKKWRPYILDSDSQ